MVCEQIYFGICFLSPSSGLSPSIFSFSEFISALALLVIVYTVTDVRYRFRVAIAPIPLFRWTYYFIGIIGFGTLTTDIWLQEQWLIPHSFISISIWQGMFGVFLISIAMTWMYYAFIRPPIFSLDNYRSYAQLLYQVILKGSDNELPIIADELIRSAESLVRFSKQDPPRWRPDANEGEQKTNNSEAAGYAHDILLLMGSRKVCRHIISSSPLTAIKIFEATLNAKKYYLPIGQFAANISTEAILNKGLPLPDTPNTQKLYLHPDPPRNLETHTENTIV